LVFERLLRALPVAMLLASSAASAAEPDEQTKAAARQLAQDGARALDAGRYAEAQDLLDRAYQLYPAPTIAVLEARTLERLGRLVEAAEHYELARHTQLGPDPSDAFRVAVTEAERDLGELRQRIPQLTISIQGVAHNHPRLDVTLDGARVPTELLGVRRPLDPGEHRIVARLGAGAPAERVVSLSERQTESVVLTLSAPRAPVPKTSGRHDPMADTSEDGSAQRTWGFVSLGVGVAGIATGVIAGVIMLNKKSRLDDVCAPTCPASSEDDLDAFRSARTVSLIGYGVGIAGLGAGTLLLLTAPSEKTEQSGLATRFGLSVSNAGIALGASGRFQ
jgi:tetratricopeptide (TPR) repeat protein